MSRVCVECLKFIDGRTNQEVRCASCEEKAHVGCAFEHNINSKSHTYKCSKCLSSEPRGSEVKVKPIKMSDSEGEAEKCDINTKLDIIIKNQEKKL